MVDANQIYGNGSGGDFLSVEIARENKLLNKWFKIKTAEVRELTETDFKTQEQRQVDKIVISFDEIDYELPLNKTNARTLINDVGPESDDWIGYPIKLKVHMWTNNKEGIVIKSKKELDDDGEEIPKSSSSSSKILNPNAKLKRLCEKYENIDIAAGIVTGSGFDLDTGGIFTELSKMQRAGEINAKELQKYKTLLHI